MGIEAGDIEVRVIGPDDVPAYTLADSYAFSYRPEDPELHEGWVTADLDRALAACDGPEIVGTGRNYSLELTLPGAPPVPAGAVSWISVRPTHRRRGILTRVMGALLDDSEARGETVSMLTASEGAIYSRFGYGVAARHRGVRLHTREVAFRAGRPPGRLRMVEPGESARLAPELYERVRRARAGAVSRSASWWPGEWAPTEEVKPRFDVVYEVEGRVDGIAVYAVRADWSGGISSATVVVRDLLPASPEAEAALWRFLCDIDLAAYVEADRVPVDTELPWLITDPRQVRTTLLNDWLWVRPLDTPRYLTSRRYGASERLVLDVQDPFRPAGAAAGRFALEAGPDGAACTPTSSEPDLVLDVAALGAISLGDTPPSVLGRAQRIDERVAGALGAADRVFAAERSPFSFTWF